jgi:hypothetical protein
VGRIDHRGRLAQLVERLPYKEEVGGSSPSPPTHKCLQRNHLLRPGTQTKSKPGAWATIRSTSATLCCPCGVTHSTARSFSRMRTTRWPARWRRSSFPEPPGPGGSERAAVGDAPNGRVSRQRERRRGEWLALGSLAHGCGPRVRARIGRAREIGSGVTRTSYLASGDPRCSSVLTSETAAARSPGRRGADDPYVAAVAIALPNVLVRRMRSSAHTGASAMWGRLGHHALHRLVAGATGR